MPGQAMLSLHHHRPMRLAMAAPPLCAVAVGRIITYQKYLEVPFPFPLSSSSSVCGCA